MIQNALTKAEYGARLSFSRRLPLLPCFTSLTSKPASRWSRNAVLKLNLPPTMRTLSQRLFYTTNLTPNDYEYDTIYALSTASGRAAVAIVRISGPGS
jgi:tRNA modification GTPase